MVLANCQGSGGMKTGVKEDGLVELGLKQGEACILEGVGSGRLYGNLATAPITQVEEVSDAQAIHMMHHLLRAEGLFLGGSSGLNVMAALRTAARLPPGAIVVTVACDSGANYLAKHWSPAVLSSLGLPSDCGLHLPALSSSSSSSSSSIHGVDQRSSQLLFEHPALPAPLRLVQHGALSPRFRPDTSSVVWPMAWRLARLLCDEPSLLPQLSSSRVAVLGAGLGLVGLTAAALGAQHVLLTDGAPAAARENAEASGLDNVAVAECVWGRQAAGQWEAVEVVLASDVIYNQGALPMQQLVQAASAMARTGTRWLLAYEHREDWETLDAFWEAARAEGWEGEGGPVEGWDEDQLLLDLTKK